MFSLVQRYDILAIACFATRLLQVQRIMRGQCRFNRAENHEPEIVPVVLTNLSMR
ncbi:hypothetical protein Mapa_005233 [Marchantia paleacea]|nr:hypothetical protein Mapa_005233 [Marchantia paleacea]